MRARRAGAVAALALCLGAAPTADAARLAVGLAPGADRAEVAERLRARGARGIVDLAPLPALSVSAPRAAALRGIRGTRYVEVLGSRRQAFVPNDPLLQRQWYAAQNRAFDFWPSRRPLRRFAWP